MAFSFSPKVATEGLVLALDAANPRSYPGSGTSWRDLTANGNNGILTNGPTFNGANGGSIQFDGVDDYVNLGVGFSSLIPNTSYTACAWVNLDNTLANYPIFSYRNVNDSSKAILIQLDYFSSNFRFLVRDINNVLGTSTNNRSSSNRWYYVVGVRTGNTINVYVDGIAGISDTQSFSDTYQNLSSFYVGRLQATSSNVWIPGKISSAQIYNRALSAAEILQNYNALKGRFGLT